MTANRDGTSEALNSRRRVSEADPVSCDTGFQPVRAALALGSYGPGTPRAVGTGWKPVSQDAL
jgi:hypothetical protein